MSKCKGCAPKIHNPLKPFKYTHLPWGEARKVGKAFYECAFIILRTVPDDANRQDTFDKLLCLRDDVLARSC